MNTIHAPPGARNGTGPQDASQSRKDTKPYGLLVEAVFKACDFQRFASRPAVNFVDVMSGPGRLGLDLREKLREAMPDKFPRFAFYFNDVDNKPLMNLAEIALIAPCNIYKLGQRFPVAFHIAAVRYGISDLSHEEQRRALASIYESMVPGGRLVIADMLAYSVQQQEGLMRVHSMRQKLAGKKGTCYITTIPEWTYLLRNAGFQNVDVPFTGTSDVATRDWKGEFGGDELKITVMNRVIHDTAAMNSEFQKGCEVVFKHMEASLKFPIMVMTGDKPEARPK
jgi:hypothetical protein